MAMATEQPSEPVLPTAGTPHRRRLLRIPVPTLRRSMREGFTPSVLVRILLPLIHLFLELLRLLLIGKAQAEAAILALEGVEEGAVLEVLEAVVDLLIPDDAAVGGADVDELDPESVAHQVVGEHRGAL